MLNGKSILITGGTGELGKKLVTYLLDHHPKINKIVVFSRDEKKQKEMTEQFPLVEGAPTRYFIGDIRDKERLKWACEDMDVVIHLAGMSDIETINYNPFEALKTNVVGSQNLIEACLATKVTDVISVSFGNGSSPGNLFEASKILSEKLFIAANNIIGEKPVKFSVVRFPSLFGLGNEELTKIKKSKNRVKMPLNGLKPTRFLLSYDYAAKFIVNALTQHWGGEVFIPKCLVYELEKFAKSLDVTLDISGEGSASHVHEQLISSADLAFAFKLDKHYVICPDQAFWNADKWKEHFKAKPISFDELNSEKMEKVSDTRLQDLTKKYFL